MQEKQLRERSVCKVNIVFHCHRGHNDLPSMSRNAETFFNVMSQRILDKTGAGAAEGDECMQS